jgi:hypothetical protein
MIGFFQLMSGKQEVISDFLPAIVEFFSVLIDYR